MEQTVTYESNNLNLEGVLNKINDSDEIVVICHARTSSKDSTPTEKSLSILKKECDTVGSIRNIDLYFDNIINYFNKNNIEFDQINLRPSFSIITDEKYYDKNKRENIK